MRLANICGFLGAAVMVAAPFFIDTDAGKIAAIIGLSLLTVQSIENRLYNLIFLNIASIMGYLYALYF